MYVLLLYPHFYIQMDVQCNFLLFLLVFGMVTSSLPESIHAQEDVLENEAVLQALHDKLNKIQR